MRPQAAKPDRESERAYYMNVLNNYTVYMIILDVPVLILSKWAVRII